MNQTEPTTAPDTSILLQLRSGVETWLKTQSLRGINAREYLVAFLAALLMTCAFCFFLNSLLIWRVHSQFSHGRLAESYDSASAAEYIGRLVNQKIFQDSFRGTAIASFEGKHTQPASEQLLLLLGDIQKGESQKTEAVVRSSCTGQLSGWRIFWLSTHPTSGAQVVRELERDDNFKTLLSIQEKDADGYRQSLVSFSNKTIELVNPTLRQLQRFNGPIQWMVYLLFFMIVVLVAKRLYLVSRLLKETSQADPISVFEGSTCLESQNQLSQQIMSDFDSGVHEPLNGLLGLIPSLGFIGTVIGMGEAMMAADSLFISADRQAAVGQITQKLGYAFDTTLLALILASLAAILLMALRYQERNYSIAIAGQSDPEESAS